MKIKNEEVSVKIGNKTKVFTNLIMNSYLDLFADSFLNFKSKNLPYCLVNFTKGNSDIDKDSIKMQYDTILEADFASNIETLTENNIINKYFYQSPVADYPYLQDFQGKQIMQLGFANWDDAKQDYVLYAYLDISKYNITIQENQPIIISRVDKISSDMNFWGNDNKLKAPYHLTGRGLLELQGMDYSNIYPKLYSIGFGIFPYKYIDEYLLENLNIEKTGTGEITITGINNNFAKPDLYPKESTANLLIYKFKMFREYYEDPMLPPILEDTGLFYVQYKELNRYGVIDKLKIKYERG